MEQKKFIRYCPNCNNYNESTGVCGYIHENVLQYPDKFIKYCDGKYLSLIKGKAIESFNGSLPEDADTDEDKLIMVSVFSTNNNALFQVAKSILNNYGIKYFSSGEFVNPLNPAVYSTDIKVFEKDEKTALKLLSQIIQNPYTSTNKSEKKLLSLRWFWNVVIIILFILLMVMVYLLLK